MLRHIETAFRVDATRIDGPKWIAHTAYEIYYETNEPSCDFRLLLRQLLVEQFHLITRLEERAGVTLELTTPFGEPRRSPSEFAECRKVQSAHRRA